MLLRRESSSRVDERELLRADLRWIASPRLALAIRRDLEWNAGDLVNLRFSEGTDRLRGTRTPPLRIRVKTMSLRPRGSHGSSEASLRGRQDNEARKQQLPSP